MFRKVHRIWMNLDGANCLFFKKVFLHFWVYYLKLTLKISDKIFGWLVLLHFLKLLKWQIIWKVIKYSLSSESSWILMWFEWLPLFSIKTRTGYLGYPKSAQISWGYLSMHSFRRSYNSQGMSLSLRKCVVVKTTNFGNTFGHTWE